MSLQQIFAFPGLFLDRITRARESDEQQCFILLSEIRRRGKGRRKQFDTRREQFR